MSDETPAEPEKSPTPNAEPASEAEADAFGKPVPQTAEPEEPPEPGGG